MFCIVFSFNISFTGLQLKRPNLIHFNAITGARINFEFELFALTYMTLNCHSYITSTYAMQNHQSSIVNVHIQQWYINRI